MNTESLLLRIRTGIVVLYSLAIIASSTPTFGAISNTIVIVYFLFVPGYVLTLYFNEDYAIVQRLFYGVILGMTLVFVIFAVRDETLDAFPLPFDVIIPAGTVFLILLNYYRLKSAVVLN